ncbi:MAG: hypothetical protein HY790_04640 [Deltaproteobacteria bacterium]|nr:hypothetical protein [Deltaproteobacteria bacterium]
MIGKIKYLKELAGIANRIFPTAKRLYEERKAIKWGIEPENIFLRKVVSEVIGRITNLGKNEAWFKSIFSKFCNFVIDPPEIFKVVAIKEWLNDDAVKDGLCKIISARLIQTSCDISDIKKILEEKSSNYTLERPEIVSYAIDIVVFTVVASIVSSLELDQSSRMLALIVQEGTSRILTKFDDLSDQLSKREVPMNDITRNLPIKSIISALKRRELSSIKELLEFYWDKLPNEMKAESLILIGDTNKFESLVRHNIEDNKLKFWDARGDLLRGKYHDSIIKLLDLYQHKALDSYYKIQCMRNIGNILTDFEFYDLSENVFNTALSQSDFEKNNMYFKAKIFTDLTRLACRTRNLKFIDDNGKKAIFFCKEENFPWIEQIVVIEILKFYEGYRLEGYIAPDIIIPSATEKRINKINEQLGNMIGIMSWNLVRSLRLLNEGKKFEACELLKSIIRNTSGNPFNFYGTYEASLYLINYCEEVSVKNNVIKYIDCFNNEKRLISEDVLGKISLCFPNI